MLDGEGAINFIGKKRDSKRVKLPRLVVSVLKRDAGLGLSRRVFGTEISDVSTIRNIVRNYTDRFASPSFSSVKIRLGLVHCRDSSTICPVLHTTVKAERKTLKHPRPNFSSLFLPTFFFSYSFDKYNSTLKNSIRPLVPSRIPIDNFLLYQ